jgi:hypothetical protein
MISLRRYAQKLIDKWIVDPLDIEWALKEWEK